MKAEPVNAEHMPIADASLAAKEVRQAVMAFVGRLRASNRASGLSLVKLGILEQLLRQGDRTPGELAMKSGVQPQSLTRVLASLEQDGLISRGKNEQDMRQHLMSLNEAGRKALKVESQRREQWLETQMSASLSDAEIVVMRAAADILHRLAAG